MPRKPQPKKRKIALPVNGKVIDVTLHPPTKSKKSWYAYWPGLSFTRSTGQRDFDEAVKAVESMLKSDGRKAKPADIILTDDEFILIQERHYSKAQGEDAKKRAMSSLRSCLEAISAFQSISGLHPITTATPDDCERFQAKALTLPKNWRIRYSESGRSKTSSENGDEIEHLSANTVRKWSTALQAAFERANRNAGKKCVRGVVVSSKLLSDNPWKHFTWIEGSAKPIRHFTLEELRSLLEWFDAEWSDVTVAPAFVKVCLWSWARRREVSSLRWSDERRFGDECHFKSVGKWGVVKWFRIPEALRQELQSIRCESEFVFGDYPRQLIRHHEKRFNPSAARRVRPEFDPYNLGDWMYRQMVEWSKDRENGHAYLHVFRKTGLQFALAGEHVKHDVASDARVTEAVMSASYAQEFDEELRHKSNRTFRRILSSLPIDIAVLYGYEESQRDRLVEQLDQARVRFDWGEVARLAAEINSLVSNDQKGVEDA